VQENGGHGLNFLPPPAAAGMALPGNQKASGEFHLPFDKFHPSRRGGAFVE